MTETPTHTPLPALSRGPTDELIPCPAGHTGTTRNNNNIYGAWWVQCCKCSWRVAGDTEAEALTAWNTRADSHHRLVEALEAFVNCARYTPHMGGTSTFAGWSQGALRDAEALARAALKEASHEG